MKQNQNVVELDNEVSLIIPSNVQDQINYLHRLIGNKEWSGVLLYEKVGGNFKTLKELEFKVLGIYPMNVGSHAYTEFEYGSAIAEIYDLYPDKLENLKLGLIHTHHTMAAFFSGTDLDELYSNAKQNNFYLSLVVNLSGPYEAKVAVSSNTKTKREFRVLNEDGEYINWVTTRDEENIITLKVKVIQENASDVPSWFSEQYRKIADEAATKATAKSWDARTGYDYNNRWNTGYRGYDYKKYDDDKYFKKEPVQKSLPKPATESREDVWKFYTDATLSLCNSILGLTCVSLVSAVRVLSKRKSTEEMTDQEGLELYTQINSRIKLQLAVTDSQADDEMNAFHLAMMVECLEDAQESGDIPDAGLLTDVKHLIDTYAIYEPTN